MQELSKEKSFETFRQDGPLKMDVADTRSLKLDAEEGKEIVEEDDIQRLLFYADAVHRCESGPEKTFLGALDNGINGGLLKRIRYL
ncbi:hypothetical protein Bca52824_021161 [Brassica carinata]|uniref:Uncharacterized protein n=1 Tax=Brassica carinata TaxID=52824 RepID=A0A8X8AZ83_BRACI|nr:hypothetical protein Bca52824_021161 [Brassica carinata]